MNESNRCNEADCAYPKCDCWERKNVRVLEFPGYGPTMPRVYLPVTSIISFKLIDFNGNYGTHIELPEGRYIRVGVYPEEVKKALAGVSNE